MAGFFKILIDFIGLCWARGQALAVANFLAFKIVLTTLFMVALPILLNNVLYSLVQDVINMMSNVSLPSLNSPSFAGLAGYLLTKCRFLDVISLLLSAYVTRLTIRIISLGKI